MLLSESAERPKKLFNERTGLDVSTKIIRKFFSRISTFKPLLTDRQIENRLN